MKSPIIPLGDKIVILPQEEGEQTYGNIVVPDMGKEKPEMGEVIAAGKGRMSEFGQFIPVNHKVGDVVLVPKIGTLRIDFEGDEYYIAQDKEVLAVVKESDNE